MALRTTHARNSAISLTEGNQAELPRQSLCWRVAPVGNSVSWLLEAFSVFKPVNTLQSSPSVSSLLLLTSKSTIVRGRLRVRCVHTCMHRQEQCN